MFLKSLSMKGFKSFADPTVLEFEPGITVVVGPNGSGKSNVVDAVTWVLGAQGPRSLRSAKMEDVIFAGTSSRPQLGRAEVSLTIDNSSGKLPIDLSEVTITRTLFRSGDSEYAINGAPCRLLDIQELLSDSGVGRQQHMIIGQGQLDTVLNARPEDRRAIIEEAAGVLKHRRRRERAERRLGATAENLERLGDLVREVRRQIRPLERQAAAARSHDTVATELLAVRRYLAGTELADLTARRRAAAQNLAVCRDEEGELHVALEQLDAEATSTTAELSSRREEDLANALGRVQGLVERARGLSGVLRERGRGVVAALDANADVDVVSTLEAEAARLASELAVAEAEEAAGFAPERTDLTAALEALDGEVRGLRERWSAVLGDDEPDQALARVRARTDLMARSAGREQQDLDALGSRVGSLEQRVAGAAVRADLLEQAAVETDEATAGLEADLAARSSELEAIAHGAEEAQVAADQAEQARHRTAARAEALERALSDLQGAGGRELLREVDGVVGSLVDLVEIDEGWDAAFEAAAGAGVAAVVVDGRRSAQAALTTLRERGVTGAVLAPRQPGSASTASAASAAAALPPGSSADPVRGHVRARHGGAVAESVLDSLVGRAVRVDGWEEAIDLSLARDDLVVVTPEGDRFAATGWRVRSGTGVVTAAAVDEARRRAEEAAAAAELARAHLTEARIALSRARDARAGAERAADRHASACEAGRRDRERAAEEQRRLAGELDDARAPRWPRRNSGWPTSRPSRRSWRGRSPSSRRRWRRGRRSGTAGPRWPGVGRSSRCAWRASPSGAASWPSARPRSSGACWATPRSARRRLRAGAGWSPRAPHWPAWKPSSPGSTSGSTASSHRCATTIRTRSTPCGPAVSAWSSCARTARRPSIASMRCATAHARSTSRRTRSACAPRHCTSTSRAISARSPTNWPACPSLRHPRARRWSNTPRSSSANSPRSAR